MDLMWVVPVSGVLALLLIFIFQIIANAPNLDEAYIIGIFPDSPLAIF